MRPQKCIVITTVTEKYTFRKTENVNTYSIHKTKLKNKAKSKHQFTIKYYSRKQYLLIIIIKINKNYIACIYSVFCNLLMIRNMPYTKRVIFYHFTVSTDYTFLINMMNNAPCMLRKVSYKVTLTS